MKVVAGTSQPIFQLVVVDLGTTFIRDFSFGKEDIVAQIVPGQARTFRPVVQIEK